MNRFAIVPPGEVTLRDARRSLERTVALGAFEIATTPITAGEYRSGAVAPGRPADAPAHGVRWREAVEWCIEASRRDGLTPSYARSGGTVTWAPHADGYRLPTEAEWVRAASGGVAGARYGPLAEIAWTAGDGVASPQPVAGKRPNAWGVFDALGNVWEWCWDRLDPARYGDYRVLKGGGWADAAWNCRVGVRRGNAPDALIEDAGFRVVRGAVAVSTDGLAHGWSEAADRRRAALPPPLPVGWTPLRVGDEGE